MILYLPGQANIGEQERRETAFASGFIVAALMATAIFACILNGSNSMWRSQAIKHNAAHYNPTTGVFEWNDATTRKEITQ